MSRSQVTSPLAAMFCIAGLLATASVNAADPNPGAVNAATQARAKMQQSHQQTGTIGGGYRPWSAWNYVNTARTNADTLSAYGQHAQQLPAETAQEHLTEIQRNLESSKKELAKLGAEAAQEAGVHEQVASIEKHLTAAGKMCSMMEKTITKEGVATHEMCTHCMETSKELKAAEDETLKLMKTLGISPPSAAQAHHDHHASPEK